LIIQKNGKLVEYKIAVIEKDPYPKSEIILDNSTKEIVSSENAAKRDEESKFFNNLLNTKTNLRYFTLPFLNPLDNMKIVSVFGNSRIYKDKNNNILYTSTHLGVDLKASENTKVYAISTARVAFAGYSLTRGNCIYLDHGYGLYSSYFHLNKVNVKEGQIVFTGDLIGYSGSTGISTGPHLHLGASFLGINLDPISLINEMNEIEQNYSQIEMNQNNK
jgi:murein DD-endopeptidase MepM/ murein hydrolase activator NlpD